MSEQLAGRVALVTGAGQGIGEAIARLFAEEGAVVVVADLNEANAEKVAGAIGERAVAVGGDVSRFEDFDAMAKAATEGFGRLDIVVNNAGTSHRNRPMLEVDEAEYDKVMAVNVKSIYQSARAAVPVFRAQGDGGCFVNIASTAGLRPRPGLVWYNSSKAAVIGMTKSMAIELAPERIRVNAVCPVATETPLLATFMGEDTPEKRALFQSSVPLGRLGQPLDIARSVLWLASGQADFVTGVALEVDGGRCI